MASFPPVGKTGTTRYDGLFDVVQMLSGAFLALFVCMHMVFLSSVLFGAGAMDGLSALFEAVHAEAVGGAIVVAAFVAHIVAVGRKIPFRMAESIVMYRHARLLHHADTWRWVVQVLTALVLLLMVTVHMWEGFMVMPVAAGTSAVRVQHGPWGFFYLALLPVLVLHLAIGVWRLSVKWGALASAARPKARRWERWFIGAFLGLALLTLLRLWTLPL